MIGQGHTCDIWKPSHTVSSRNEYLNARYSLQKSSVTCRFHEMNAQQRLEAGLGVDLSQDMQIVVFKGNVITELDQYYLLYFREEGSFWLVSRPVNHTTVPKEYWRAYLDQVKTVQAEVLAYYA